MTTQHQRPSSPPFFSFKVRKTILVAVYHSVCYAVVAWVLLLLLNTSGVLKTLTFMDPSVLVLMLLCSLSYELAVGNHYRRVSRKLGVSENLFFIFSLLLLLAGFVGWCLFSE